MFKTLSRGRGSRRHGNDGLGSDDAPWVDTDSSHEERGMGWRARWGWGRHRATSGAAATDLDPSGAREGHQHGKGMGPGHGKGMGMGMGPGHDQTCGGRHHGLRHGDGPHFEGRSLNDIPPGQSCRIFALHGRGAIRQRLMDMGFVPNTTLTVMRSAPLNDPIEVKAGATLVSVRRAEAARIEVVHV